MVLSDSEKLSRSLLLLPGCGFILSLLFLVLCTSIDIEAATFARDAKTELSVDPPGSADASGIFGLAYFAESPCEEDFDFSGSLKLDGKIYRLEESSDQKSNARVVIEGDLEGEQLEVKTSGLIDWRKKEYELSGTYRKLSNTELQQRAQLRYDVADTGLLCRSKRWNQCKCRVFAGRGCSVANSSRPNNVPDQICPQLA